MTLRWIEGFELDRHNTYTDRLYEVKAGTNLDLTNNGRRVGNSVVNTLSNPKPRLETGALSATALNEWVLGFGFKTTDLPGSAATNVAGFTFMDSSGIQCVLYLDKYDDETVVWKLARDDARDLADQVDIATSDPFNPLVWHYFELKFSVRTGTNGSCEMKMHDHYTGTSRVVMTASGVNLAAQGTDGIDRFGLTWRHSEALYLFFDDIYFLDTGTGERTDYLGDVVVLALQPSGVGDSEDWTPSGAGDNWAFVDDSVLAPEDGNYVDGGVNDLDLHVYQEPSRNLPTILGIQLRTTTLLTAAGSETLGHRVRDGGDNDNDGESFTVDSTDPDTKEEVLEQDPQTGADWTQDRLDDTQFGYEREA